MDDASRTRAQRLADVLTDLDRLLRDDAKTGKGAPFYLSPAQSQILGYVAQEGRPSEIAIARHLNVTGPTVVRLVDMLEDKGFVVRTRSKPDRRRVKISVTEEGARVNRHNAHSRYRGDLGNHCGGVAWPASDTGASAGDQRALCPGDTGGNARRATHLNLILTPLLTAP